MFLSLRQKCLTSNDLKAAYDNGEIMSSGLNVRIFTIGIVAPSLQNHKKGRQDITKFRNSNYVQALVHIGVSCPCSIRAFLTINISFKYNSRKYSV